MDDSLDIPHDHPLAGASAKIDRAGEHLEELRRAIWDFGQQGLHLVSDDSDAETGDYVIRVKAADPPLRIGTIAGNIISDLRAALDYLVYALAELDAGQPQAGTQFPIVDTPDDFDRLRPRFLKGLSDAHAARIELLQPYEGSDWTKRLREFSNPDKHRHLVPLLTLPPTNYLKVGRGAPPRIGSEAETEVPTAVLKADVRVYLGLYFDVGFEDGTAVTDALNLLQRQVALAVHFFRGEFEGPKLYLVPDG